MGRTRHFDPSPFAIAEVIFARSGWRLTNFCVNHRSRARPRASVKRKRSTDPRPSYRRRLQRPTYGDHLHGNLSCNVDFTVTLVADLILLKGGKCFKVLAFLRGAAGRRGTSLPGTSPPFARVPPKHSLA